MKFRAKLALHGKTATGVTVPPQIVGALGGKKPAVKVSLNGYAYRTTLGVMGGLVLIPVSADVRGKAGIAAGDLLDVEIELDNEERKVEVPADLAAALKKDAIAKRAYEALTPSKKKWLVLPIEEAKSPETRAKRLAKALEGLRAGSK